MDAISSPIVKEAMETSLQKRLKIRLDMVGLNPHEAALKAGLSPSYVRDILRGKSRKPTAENLEKLAIALETTIDWFTSSSFDPDKDTGPDPRLELTNMAVKGVIQAGAWLDTTLFDDDYENFEVIPVARDTRFPRAKQYGLKVIGDSMDLEYPDGTYVSCVDFYESGIPVRAGLTVHVERRNGHLVETTLKRIDLIDGQLMLCPRSSNPKHQPIPIDGDGSTEIVIRGIVTGSYRRTEI
ncbi:LexA family repressor/S24 family protease [Neorhizobium galegae bv. officinalis]|nr:LexA family repressor/S24 family protease [Neorhizobium galegae bv. officinalis]